MKKVIGITAALAVTVFAVFGAVWLTETSKVEGLKGERWELEFDIPQNSNKVVLSEEILYTDSGEFSIRNLADRDIQLYIYDAEDMENPISTNKVQAGNPMIQYDLKSNKGYCIGISAAVSEGTNIKVIVSEYTEDLGQ